MKNLIQAVVGVALFATAAQADTKNQNAGLYVKGTLGYMTSAPQSKNVSFTAPTLDSVIKNNTGVDIGAGVGVYLADDVRLDLTYSHHKLDSKNKTTFVKATQPQDRLVLAAYKDFLTDGMLSPYIMAGIGYASTESKFFDELNNRSLKTNVSKGGLVTLGVGGVLKVAKSVDIELGLTGVNLMGKKHSTANFSTKKNLIQYGLTSAVRVSF